MELVQGPDGIYGRGWHGYAVQFDGVFQHLFQLSLDSGDVPALR